MSTPKIFKSQLLLLVVPRIPLWIIWSAIQTWVLVLAGFSLKIALTDSLVSTGLLLMIGLAVGKALQYYRPDKGKFLYIFAWILGIAAIGTGIIKWALPLLISDGIYNRFLSDTLPVRFYISFLMTGWLTLLYWLLFSFNDLRQNEKRKREAEEISRDAELYKLRQQLQPHFLFNSLNSISALTANRPEEARHMIQQLADFLRGTLKNDEKAMVSLREELQHLALYLNIEKVRFGHRLNTEINNDDAALNCLIPQMILQPIVENAIKYGLYDTAGSVTIAIHASAGEGILKVSVQNPFDPQTQVSKPGAGFGLNSLQRRLNLLYARNNLIDTRAEGSLFTTTVTIPQS